MKIDVISNKRREQPYTLEVTIQTLTIDAGSVFEVPVKASFDSGTKLLEIDLCGFLLRAKRVEELPQKVAAMLQGLENYSRFPSYVFIARRAGGLYPVYTIENEVVATTPGGPVFRHVELAKVREYLTDYLHDIGVLGTVGSSDKLHARGVNPRTLGLMRPIFYLKKRVPGTTEFWAPVFESDDGKIVYTYAANARRDTPASSGPEILMLRETVAEALRADGRLNDLHDLRADRLFPEHWQQLKSLLTAEGSFTVEDREVALFRTTSEWVGALLRPDEQRYSLYVGKDEDDVAWRVERDLLRRGLLENMARVRVKAPSMMII